MTLNMGIRLFAHRGIWYVEIDGKRRSLKTKDRLEAKGLFTAVKREYLAGKLSDLTGQCSQTMRGFFDEFVVWSEQTQPRATARANRLALEKVMRHSGENTKLDRVSLKHLDQMVAECRRNGLSAASINNYIRHARSSFRKAVEWGYVKVNPFAGARELPVEKIPPRFLQKDEAIRFLSRIKDVDRRRLITAYLATGRRRSELLELTWENVDFERNTYYVGKSKAHRAKWYPLPAMFRQVLISIGKKDSGRIFDRWQHPDTLSKVVKQELRAAGYGDMHLHHLRHTFASIKAMDGTPLRILQDLLGHSEYRTTEIYAHVQEDYLAQHVDINWGPVDLGD